MRLNDGQLFLSLYAPPNPPLLQYTYHPGHTHHLAANEEPQPQLDCELGLSEMANELLIISST